MSINKAKKGGRSSLLPIEPCGGRGGARAPSRSSFAGTSLHRYPPQTTMQMCLSREIIYSTYHTRESSSLVLFFFFSFFFGKASIRAQCLSHRAFVNGKDSWKSVLYRNANLLATRFYFRTYTHTHTLAIIHKLDWDELPETKQIDL